MLTGLCRIVFRTDFGGLTTDGYIYIRFTITELDLIVMVTESSSGLIIAGAGMIWYLVGEVLKVIAATVDVRPLVSRRRRSHKEKNSPNQHCY